MENDRLLGYTKDGSGTERCIVFNDLELMQSDSDPETMGLVGRKINLPIIQCLKASSYDILSSYSS
ncbi:hypothetical protein EWB00_003273 [Schistosoma japonicum]|uniref:Uncharacterized protein n=1 Tax=Schistosoma japonicum TaxID=6182 RepID=A0A4Z2D8Z6_SCHJA|nr:hypothetical protein EWB00_003273 [Schistosoma japonicum]